MSMELDKIRREYLQGGLRRRDLPELPLTLFRQWQQQIIASETIDPTAMVLSTVDADGQPSQRIVLLKHLDDDGFVFYTNYESRKAAEMLGNDRVSLLFPWHALDRQVKICGRVERIDSRESARYFASRPRDSQLAAWASAQSRAIANRDSLQEEMDRVRQRFADAPVPCPAFWGGVRVVPHEMEFWQGGANRLHDRFLYRRQSDGSWQADRLAP